ncbi:hypothetical protein R6Q57_030190 [Mikania cordata]
MAQSDIPKVNSQKIIKPWMQVKIDFPPALMTASHSTPVVVNAKVDGHDLHRIYRVGGSVVELMYEHCFIQLDKEAHMRLKPHKASLIGFLGEKVCPWEKLLCQ